MKDGLWKVALWSWAVCVIAGAIAAVSYKLFGIVAKAPGTFTLTEYSLAVAIFAFLVGAYCTENSSDT